MRRAIDSYSLNFRGDEHTFKYAFGIVGHRQDYAQYYRESNELSSVAVSVISLKLHL